MLMLAAAVLASASALSAVSPSPALQPVPSAPRGPAAGRQEPVTPPPARIHGRFVDSDGAPLANAALRLRGWPRRAAPATPLDPLLASSRVDGTFELSFVAPAAHLFSLNVSLEGFANLDWSWDDIRAGVGVDLGEVVLPRAATIVGHIVDTDGSLLIEGWDVVALPPLAVDGGYTRVRFSSSQVQVDPETGSFRIEALPPGEFGVFARRGRAQFTNTVRVTTVAGSESQVELLFSGPGERTLLQVVMHTNAPPSAGPAQGTVWAIARDGARIALQRVPEEPRRWSVAVQEVGPYRIVVEDPTFRPAEVEGVMPGAPASLWLNGTAKLMLVVVDPTTGEELDDYGLAVRYRPDDDARSPYEIFPPGARSARSNLPIPLVPGDIELSVWSSDRPKVFFPLGALPAGHARPARVELGRGLTLVGRVVDSTGAPVPGAVVELTQGEVHGHDRPTGTASVQRSNRGGDTSTLVIPCRDHRLVTDELGAFRVLGIAAGKWAAYAHHGPCVHGTYVVDVPHTEELLVEVELVLPAFTEARLALAGFGVDCAQRFTLAVEGLWPPASPFYPPAHLGHGLALRPLPDGLFEPLLVPLGRQRFSVHQDRGILGVGTSSSVWASAEEVTPCFTLEMDLRRGE